MPRPPRRARFPRASRTGCRERSRTRRSSDRDRSEAPHSPGAAGNKDKPPAKPKNRPTARRQGSPAGQAQPREHWSTDEVTRGTPWWEVVEQAAVRSTHTVAPMSRKSCRRKLPYRRTTLRTTITSQPRPPSKRHVSLVNSPPKSLPLASSKPIRAACTIPHLIPPSVQERFFPKQFPEGSERKKQATKLRAAKTRSATVEIQPFA